MIGNSMYMLSAKGDIRIVIDGDRPQTTRHVSDQAVAEVMELAKAQIERRNLKPGQVAIFNHLLLHRSNSMLNSHGLSVRSLIT